MGNKSWAGSTMADRQAERRAKLLVAGRTLLADAGGPAVSVRAVCRTAGLTERYFYESFTDREALLLAVFDDVYAEVEAAIVEAVAGRPAREIATAAVDAVVGLTLDQPAKGRVLFVAPMTDPVLYRKVEQAGPLLAALIRSQLRPGSSDERRDLVASSLAGALAHLFHQYVAGTLSVSRSEFVNHCVQLLQTVGSMSAPARAR